MPQEISLRDKAGFAVHCSYRCVQRRPIRYHPVDVGQQVSGDVGIAWCGFASEHIPDWQSHHRTRKRLQAEALIEQIDGCTKQGLLGGVKDQPTR